MAAPAPAPAPEAKKAPAKKAVKKAAPVTTIIAKFDAGFGNSVFVRGAGADLSWDKGAILENISPNEWVWKSTKVADRLEFKLLLNDENWAPGSQQCGWPPVTRWWWSPTSRTERHCRCRERRLGLANLSGSFAPS